MSDALYLDHHSATKPSCEVLDVMTRSYREYWAAPFAPHFPAQQQIYPLQKHREFLKSALGILEQDALFFNRGNSEGIYHVLMHVYQEVSRTQGKTLFLTPATEEMTIFSSLQKMHSLGCGHKTIEVNNRGQICKQALSDAITSKTSMVCLSWANGLTGVMHPLADIAQVCADRGVLLHVDASYVLGKNIFRFQDLGAHFMTLEGSLIGALQGTGMVIAQESMGLDPFLPGQFSDNVACAAGLACAVGELEQKFELYCLEVARLRDLFEKLLEEAGIHAEILFKDVERLPNSCVIAFPGAHSEALLYLLNTRGIYASFGGGKFPPLHSVLLAMKFPPALARSALSFSFGPDIVQEQVETAAQHVVDCVKRLQQTASSLRL